MTKETKNISVMCFHDELCRVFNALMTALSLLREGAKVNELKCMPDEPKEVSDAVMKRMEEMDLPLRSFFSLTQNLPNPVMRTSSPDSRVFLIISNRDPATSMDFIFERPHCL